MRFYGTLEVAKETKVPSSLTLCLGRGWEVEAPGPNLVIWTHCLSGTAAPLSPATHRPEGFGEVDLNR